MNVPRDFLTLAPPFALAFFVIVYFLMFPEKAEKWSSIIARLFSHVSNVAEKRTVAGDIQADINSFAKATNGKVDPSIFPYGIKIEWERATNVTYDSFVRNGQVVVRLRHHSNQARNFVLATLAYVQSGFLPETKVHFDSEVSEAMDLAATNKILLEKKRLDAFPLFKTEIIERKNSLSATLRMFKILEDLDSMSMFNNILLREFADFGKRLSGIAPTDVTKQETRHFVMFCEKLTQKEPRVDVSPTFTKRYIRVSIVLITKPETYVYRGIEPHRKWINKCLAEQVDSIYVCALGSNISAARELDRSLKTDERLRKVAETTDRLPGRGGRAVDRICIAYKRVVTYA